MLKCTLFVYIIIQLVPFVNPQKKVANVTTFNPFLSRGTYLSSVGFITVPSNTPEGKKRVPTALSFGGGKGIRTLVRLLSNGFQDRLVMTTSISLRISTEIFYHIFPALSIANTVFLCLTDTKQRFLRNIERACRAKARHAVISLLIGYFFELRVELFE